MRQTMQRLLILAGLLLLAVGLVWPWISKLGLGRLPGDIRIERPGFTCLVPLASSILLSLLLTVLLNVIARLLKH